MVMKAYRKTINRMIKSNISRFIAVTSIITVGICFICGVKGITPKIANSFNEELHRQNAPDIIVKSKSITGFNAEQVNSFANVNGVNDYLEFTQIDLDIFDLASRLLVYPLEEARINKMKLIEGAYPSNSLECVVEQPSLYSKKVNIGDVISVNQMSLTVSGVVANPLYFSKEGDYSIIDQENLSYVVYLDSKYSYYLPITDIYLDLSSVDKLNYFSDKYTKAIEEEIASMKATEGFNDDNVIFLTLNETSGYGSLFVILDKIDVIASIFPFFFILVVCLVVLSTMSRLIEEERASIGCSKSLGYSNFSIQFKYISFSLMCVAIGCIAGVLLGAYILPNVIYPAFNSLYFSPKMTSKISITSGLLSSVIMICAVFMVTFYISNKEVREVPARLLQQKSPKPGKKIFLEHISFIWKKMKFKNKSSYRNIFRYRGRLLMVLVSVCGSTALTMAGIGLYDISKGKISINGLAVDTGGTITSIAVVVVIFALALCVLVLYNLTNMNISERKREIATLEVLGYTHKEVYNYIFREILIMSIMAIIIGIPAGIGLLSVILNSLAFGKIQDINWYSYIAPIVLTILFICFVDLLLIPKIKAIDMNDSLKSVD